MFRDGWVGDEGVKDRDRLEEIVFDGTGKQVERSSGTQAEQ